MKKTLGVIGGMGPMATACFMEQVIRMTRAQRDQDHLDMMIRCCPSVPDRTAYLLTKTGPSPVPALRRAGQALIRAGAEILAVPCVTAHCFLRELELPVLDGVAASARILREQGIRRVGLLATDGTRQCGYFEETLKARGITAVFPEAEDQAALMDIIYRQLKRGCPVSADRFRAIAGRLRSRGAEALILGCTELSLLRRDCPLGPGTLDVLEVLARESVLACGASLRKEYERGGDLL